MKKGKNKFRFYMTIITAIIVILLMIVILTQNNTNNIIGSAGFSFSIFNSITKQCTAPACRLNLGMAQYCNSNFRWTTCGSGTHCSSGVCIANTQCTVPSCNGTSQYCNNGQWTNCTSGTHCSSGSCVTNTGGGKWIVAYYAGWEQGTLPASAINYSDLTQIDYFAAVPTTSGTLDLSANMVTHNSNQVALIGKAHAAGVKVLITIGGMDTESAFMSAAGSSKRTTFVNNIVNEMISGGYDGVDIDWEPISSGDQANYVAFSQQLRAAMTTAKPGSILTMATQIWSTAPIVASQQYYDQINLMTYDISGLWSGWVTWHNAAVYNDIQIGSQAISANMFVNQWNTAGIPLNKMGIGTDFYGYAYKGATGPRQSITGVTLIEDNIPYSSIMDTYYQSQYRMWDSAAQAVYLSINTPTKEWVSYDDEQSIQAKADYIKTKGLGGLIIWELGGGYRTNMPAGQKDLLLQAVGKSGLK